MWWNSKNPPRIFEVGFNEPKIKIKDCGSIHLDPDEQITFVTDDGSEYDVTKKSWGFYATPSLNGRLRRFHLRAVLVKNRANQFFVLLVEKEKEGLFEEYVKSEKIKVISWMDDTEILERIEESLS